MRYQVRFQRREGEVVAGVVVLGSSDFSVITEAESEKAAIVSARDKVLAEGVKINEYRIFV